VVVAGWVGRDAVGSVTDGDWATALEIAADAEDRMSDALLEMTLPTLPPHAVRLRSPTAATTVSARERMLVICCSPRVTTM